LHRRTICGEEFPELLRRKVVAVNIHRDKNAGDWGLAARTTQRTCGYEPAIAVFHLLDVRLTVEEDRTMVKKQRLIVVALGSVLAACAVGAIGTVVWIWRFGLFAPRAPLSAFGTAVRLAFLVSAVALFLARRDAVERVTLVCVVIAAGSSVIWGLGVQSSAVAAVRLIFHELAYSMGAVAIIRIWRVLPRQRR
jgi:nitrate reductase NapE component